MVEFGGLDLCSWVVTAYLLASTGHFTLVRKISDLYGRKVVFQTAIGLFLAGFDSLRVPQNMTQLISFRSSVKGSVRRVDRHGADHHR